MIHQWLSSNGLSASDARALTIAAIGPGRYGEDQWIGWAFLFLDTKLDVAQVF